MKQSLKQRLGAAVLAVALLPELPAANRTELLPAEVTVRHFLGEHVRLGTSEWTVEEELTKQALGGQTLPPGAELSCTWETAGGAEIGTGKQLERLTPAESKTYRLQISLLLSGQSVAQKTALYHVEVVSGTITVKVRADKKIVKETDRLHFLARKDSGEIFTCTAAPERDPETGVTFLAGQFTGLPYGSYTVTPVNSERALYLDPTRTCTLGICADDDTVSTKRAYAQVGVELDG